MLVSSQGTYFDFLQGRASNFCRAKPGIVFRRKLCHLFCFFFKRFDQNEVLSLSFPTLDPRLLFYEVSLSNMLTQDKQDSSRTSALFRSPPHLVWSGASPPPWTPAAADTGSRPICQEFPRWWEESRLLWFPEKKM